MVEVAALLQQCSCVWFQWASFCTTESSGVDVAPALTSLIQLLLDPSCRTIVGFQELIQREWITGCHPFADRLGHLVQPIKSNPANAVLNADTDANLVVSVECLTILYCNTGCLRLWWNFAECNVQNVHLVVVLFKLTGVFQSNKYYYIFNKYFSFPPKLRKRLMQWLIWLLSAQTNFLFPISIGALLSPCNVIIILC